MDRRRDVDGVLVTGGTGFTGRDSTPEALLPLLDKTMPGFGELFRAISLRGDRHLVAAVARVRRTCQRDVRVRAPGIDVRVPHGVGADHPRAARTRPRARATSRRCVHASGSEMPGVKTLKRKQYEKLLAPDAAGAGRRRALGAVDRASGSWCCSKDATPPARAARSMRSANTSIRANAASSRCPRPPNAKKTQWYFQRYVAAPAGGRRDHAVRSQLVQPRRRRAGHGIRHARRRSQAFLRQAPLFEKQLVDDGILLFKYWLCCDQAEQEERFAERAGRSAQALEAVADRPAGAPALRRLHPGARGDAARHAHRSCAVDAGGFQRPEARAADADPRPARSPARYLRAGKNRRLRRR